MSSEKKNNDYLLEVEHLKQYFPVHQGFSTIPLKAVDDISFAIRPGETLGLVGESGCGKTTVGRTLLRLYQPTAGKITFDGKVLFDSGERKRKSDRGYERETGHGQKSGCQYDAIPQGNADGISGSVFLIKSPYDGGRYYRGTFGCA